MAISDKVIAKKNDEKMINQVLKMGEDMDSLNEPSCHYERTYCDIQGHIRKHKVGRPGEELGVLRERCQSSCNSDPSCKYFTLFYIREEGFCYLLSHCTPKESRCLKRNTCTSGSRNCQEPESSVSFGPQNDQPEIPTEILLMNLEREDESVSGLHNETQSGLGISPCCQRGFQA